MFTSEGFLVQQKYHWFDSYFMNCGIYSGKWYYEAVIEAPGLAQIGYTSLKGTPEGANGVGDNEFSCGYDGSRCVLFWGNKTRTKVFKFWDRNDVIGVAIDIENGTVCFYSNGQLIEDATVMNFFQDGAFEPPVFPGLTLQYSSTSIRLHFANLRYTPPGFSPISDGILGFRKVLNQYNFYEA